MFEKYIEKLRELYQENSFYVETSLSHYIDQLEKDVQNEKKVKRPSLLSGFGINENEDIVYLTILIIFLLVFGFLVGAELGIYLFGLVFFIAGFFIGLLKGFGLVFLFSHGGTGLAIMIYSLIKDTSLLSRFHSSNIYFKIYLIIIFLVFICAILGMVIYNLSDRLKENKNHKVYLFGLFLIGFVLVGIIKFLPF